MDVFFTLRVRNNKVMNCYPTNLADNQWQVIEKFLDVQERKRMYSLRNIVNAMNFKVYKQLNIIIPQSPIWCII